MIEKKDKDSIKLLHADIESSLKNIQFPNDLTTDPNLIYDMTEQLKLSAKENHLNPRKVKINRYKHKKTPWITKGILNSVKFRWIAQKDKTKSHRLYKVSNPPRKP